MQTLSELCLNTIEESGADTRDLAALPQELPKRMWSRHPVLKIFGSYIIEHDLETELRTTIEVVYTGVYTMRCLIDFGHYSGAPLREEVIEKAYEEVGLPGPTQYEKTFEVLEGELSEEQADWLENECFSSRNPSTEEWIETAKLLGRRNLLATEIGHALLRKGNASRVEISLEGPVDLSLGTWEDDVDNFWSTIEPIIAQALKFMKAYVSV